MDVKNAEKFVDEMEKKLEKRDFRGITPGHWAVALVVSVLILFILSFTFSVLGWVFSFLFWLVTGKLFWLVLLGLGLWALVRYARKRF